MIKNFGNDIVGAEESIMDKERWTKMQEYLQGDREKLQRVLTHAQTKLSGALSLEDWVSIFVDMHYAYDLVKGSVGRHVNDAGAVAARKEDE